jgi:hypothetical protein
MKWKNFSLENKRTPIEVVEETLNGFNNATNGLLDLTLFEKSDVEKFRKKDPFSFQYDLILHSKYMKSYRFDVFELFFDSTLYPCGVMLEPGIGNELQANIFEPVIFNDEEDFKLSIEKVFMTKRFEDIVEGLMKISTLSKKGQDNQTSLY